MFIFNKKICRLFMSIIHSASPVANFRPSSQDSTVPVQENLANVEEMYDSSIEGLQNKCDKYVSVLRNTVVSLGEILKDRTLNPSQFKDLFTFPISNLELGRKKLEWVQIKVREKYKEVGSKEDRYFCNTYLKVNDLKSWGYRFVDYASASVALAMIFIEAARSQEESQNTSGLASHWAVTGSLLVLSKALSATTDYRNKKMNEKALERARLLDLKYRCDKIYEAAAIIELLKAMTRSVEEIDPLALKCQLNRSIRALKEESVEIVPRSVAKNLKIGLCSLLEKKIYREAGSVGLLNFQIQKRDLKKIFDAWNRLRFSLDEEKDSGEGQSFNLGNCLGELEKQVYDVVEGENRPQQSRLTSTDKDVEQKKNRLEEIRVEGLGTTQNVDNFSLSAQLQYGTGNSTQRSWGSFSQHSLRNFVTQESNPSNLTLGQLASPQSVELATDKFSRNSERSEIALVPIVGENPQSERMAEGGAAEDKERMESRSQETVFQNLHNYNLSALSDYGTGNSTQRSLGSATQISFGVETPRENEQASISPPNLLQLQSPGINGHLC